MNYVDSRIVRRAYLPMPEEARQKFERFRKDFETKEVKDSLIKDFATGALYGAIGIPPPVFIYASQIFPQSTDWKVRAIACLFFTVTCAIFARCLGLKDFFPFNPLIISNS